MNTVQKTSPVHVDVRRISQRFRSGRGADLLALDRVDLQAQRGEFVSIVGPSGCGKSTLLYIVAGLLQASEGEVVVDGRPIDGPDPDRGLVLQNSSIFPWRTVEQNVAFGPEMCRMPQQERRKLVDHYLDMVGLAKFASFYPRELSGGMKQRIAIAQMLACGPSLCLMDEPFGALDSLSREVLQDQLLQLWERDRKTVLFVTHSIDEAVLLSDRIVVMSPLPGRVKEIVDVDLPRPRQNTRALPEFGRLRNRIWSAIRQESMEAIG
jgi:NitT/TauT family transport system ATP-binding protein